MIHEADMDARLVQVYLTTHFLVKTDIRRKPPEVVRDFLEEGSNALALPFYKQMILAFCAGSFICFGATLSIVLGTGSSGGVAKLFQGIGFAAGFSFVILSGALLFTEVNVVLPDVLILAKTRHVREEAHCRPWVRVVRLWLLVYLGNVLGALAVGLCICGVELLDENEQAELSKVVDKKMQVSLFWFNLQLSGTVTGWFQVLLSAILGNWLVGLAALFAHSARTLTSKYHPITDP